MWNTNKLIALKIPKFAIPQLTECRDVIPFENDKTGGGRLPADGCQSPHAKEPETGPEIGIVTQGLQKLHASSSPSFSAFRKTFCCNVDLSFGSWSINKKSSFEFFSVDGARVLAGEKRMASYFHMQ